MVFVMPSSSARCSQLPRSADKMPFYIAIRRLRDAMRGLCPPPKDEEVTFTDYTQLRNPDPLFSMTSMQMQGGGGGFDSVCGSRKRELKDFPVMKY